jgi:hypothetical protein
MGNVKVRVAALTPVAGAVVDPFRNCIETRLATVDVAAAGYNPTSQPVADPGLESQRPVPSSPVGVPPIPVDALRTRLGVVTVMVSLVLSTVSVLLRKNLTL